MPLLGLVFRVAGPDVFQKVFPVSAALGATEALEKDQCRGTNLEQFLVQLRRGYSHVAGHLVIGGVASQRLIHLRETTLDFFQASAAVFGKPVLSA